MSNPLILKLEHFTRLSHDDRQGIERACALRVRSFDAREMIINEGDKPAHVNVVLSGWACRYKVLEDGRRQIIGIYLPGDFCDLKVFILKQVDHAVAAVSAVTVAEVPVAVIDEMTNRNTRQARALWWASLVTEAIEREWIVNLGQRTAAERLGHLFCEMFYRLRCVGLTEGRTYHLPLTQAELAEATGMSNVHVNRSMKELREAGLIEIRGRTLKILDLAGLEKASLFTPNYLHLEREGSDYDANEPRAPIAVDVGP